MDHIEAIRALRVSVWASVFAHHLTSPAKHVVGSSRAEIAEAAVIAASNGINDMETALTPDYASHIEAELRALGLRR